MVPPFKIFYGYQGVLELKESHSVDHQTDVSIQYFLDRFYMSRYKQCFGVYKLNFINLVHFSRISIRMLINQHSYLFDPDADRDTPRIGMIDPRCKVRSVIMEAFNNASFLCEEYYRFYIFKYNLI